MLKKRLLQHHYSALLISVKRPYLPLLFFLFAFWVGAETYYDLDIGIGIGSLHHSCAEFIRYGGTVRFDKVLLHARVVDMQRHSDPPDPQAGSGGQFLEAGILPGALVTITPAVKMNFLAGLSFVYCTRFTEDYYFSSSDSPATWRTIGFPFAIELLFLPFKKFGPSLSLTGNLNVPNSYAGAAVTIHYGKLR